MMSMRDIRAMLYVSTIIPLSPRAKPSVPNKTCASVPATNWQAIGIARERQGNRSAFEVPVDFCEPLQQSIGRAA
jgi:hypothetical protein